MQVLVSVAEHHSNLVPWQLACQATGATLKHVPLTKDGRDLDMQVLLVSDSTRTCPDLWRVVCSGIFYTGMSPAVMC